MEMILQSSLKEETLLNSWATIHFWSKILFYGVSKLTDITEKQKDGVAHCAMLQVTHGQENTIISQGKWTHHQLKIWNSVLISDINGTISIIFGNIIQMSTALICFHRCHLDTKVMKRSIIARSSFVRVCRDERNGQLTFNIIYDVNSGTLNGSNQLMFVQAISSLLT
jgi:hypothetical protein